MGQSQEKKQFLFFEDTQAIVQQYNSVKLEGSLISKLYPRSGMGNCDPTYIPQYSRQNGLPNQQTFETRVHRPAPQPDDQLYSFSYRQQDGHTGSGNNNFVINRTATEVGRSQLVHREPESQFRVERRVEANGTKDLAFVRQQGKVTNIQFQNNYANQSFVPVQKPISVRNNYNSVGVVNSPRASIKVGSPPLPFANGQEVRKSFIFNYANQQSKQYQPVRQQVVQVAPQQTRMIYTQQQLPLIVPTQNSQIVPRQVHQSAAQVKNEMRSEDIPVLKSILVPQNQMPAFNQMINTQVSASKQFSTVSGVSIPTNNAPQLSSTNVVQSPINNTVKFSTNSIASVSTNNLANNPVKFSINNTAQVPFNSVTQSISNTVVQTSTSNTGQVPINNFVQAPTNNAFDFMKMFGQSNGRNEISVQQTKQQETNAKIQNQAKSEKPKAEAPKEVSKQVAIKERDHLQPKLDFQQDFLTHHLKYELSLTKKTSMKRIRRRQILEHIFSESNWMNYRGPKDLKVPWVSYFESFIPAWIQHTFLDIWQQAHDDFFNKHLDYKFVRNKIAEQFLHELYQLKEFAESSMVTLNFFYCDVDVMLQSFMQFSDDALLNLFKKLKDRYPQTTAKEEIEFPDVPTTKSTLNLFDNFTALSFSDPKNLNYQTIYEDINYLLKRAAEEQADFKNDMKDILGDDVLACTKVGRVVRNGKTSFNACAVRRVFVKWAENLLQKCPDLYHTRSFMRFIQSRGRIVNNFIFKSTVTATTHKIVIDTISLLLQVAKFNLKDVADPKRREQFIFNIYDLLRCKIKRGTPTDIVALLRRMESTSVTKSGKKFQVIRVKNRFKTNNRDLLINFRYGDVLVGEAQLCVDNSSSVSKVGKLNYDFCHYIYELERSLFGPTLELVMEYEDFQRPDITVSFEAEDLVKERGDQLIQSLQIIDRKCLQGHNMISLTGNIFYLSEEGEEGQEDDEDITINCNYCDKKVPCTTRYDYCYLCGCVFCTECREEYKKAKRGQPVSIQNTHLIPQVSSVAEVRAKCVQEGTVAVLFWLQGSSASELMRDGLIYHQSKLLIQLNKYIPKVVFAKYNESPNYLDLMRVYKIDSFPSLVLCEGKGLPVHTLVGASFYQTGVLWAIQSQMLKGVRNQAHNQYCLEDRKLMELRDVGDNEKRCLGCFSTSKLDHYGPELKGKGFFCEEDHYTCLNCCYISTPQPNVYRDYTGLNYMSSKFVKPAIQKCPSGHKIELKYIDSPEEWQYKCSKCQKVRYVDNQHGFGECTSCKIKYCAKCLGADIPSFHDLYAGFTMVRHSVESTAEEAVRCICKRYFRKAYQTRSLTQDGLMVSNEFASWNCSICKREGKEGELHLVCIKCAVFNEGKDDADMANFIVCYDCAKKTKILSSHAVKKTDEESCVFVCPFDKQDLVLTSRAYKNKLTFKCSQCQLSYFGNSERFYCKKCDSNYCKNCRSTLDNYIKAPKCQQLCPEGDPLKFGFVHVGKQLQFCDGCMCALFDQQFACSQHQYSLCKDCVNNNPPSFIGQSKNAFKAVSMSIFKNFVNLDSNDVKNENKPASLSFMQMLGKVK